MDSVGQKKSKIFVSPSSLSIKKDSGDEEKDQNEILPADPPTLSTIDLESSKTGSIIRQPTKRAFETSVV